jgi:hypothetical protein
LHWKAPRFDLNRPPSLLSTVKLGCPHSPPSVGQAPPLFAVNTGRVHRARRSKHSPPSGQAPRPGERRRAVSIFRAGAAALHGQHWPCSSCTEVQTLAAFWAGAAPRRATALDFNLPGGHMLCSCAVSHGRTICNCHGLQTVRAAFRADAAVLLGQHWPCTPCTVY